MAAGTQLCFLLLLCINFSVFSCLETEKRYLHSYVKDSDQLVFEREAPSRAKRDTGDVTATEKKSDRPNPSQLTSVVYLNDSHQQLFVQWAGKGSDVIITLARDLQLNSTNSSAVFVSYDYGRSFKNKTSLFIVNNEPPSLAKFVNSAARNSHFVFCDPIKKRIFVSRDFCGTVSAYDVPFIPESVSLHPTREEIMLGTDKNDKDRKLYLSEDFGLTWTMIQMGVKAFAWGIAGIDNQNTLFIEREEPTGKSTILMSQTFFRDASDTTILITGIEEFQLVGKYMFAVKKYHSGSNVTQQLHVSYMRKPFQQAVFPTTNDHIEYFIADASENQVFICVNHNGMHSNLYVSDTQGIRYSLSLERILFFSPHGAGSNTWLSFVSQKPFVDLHKVNGLKGIYIASRLKSEGSKIGLGPDDVYTVITFNNGGEWNPIPAPEVNMEGQRINCEQANNCSLHLSQRFAQLYPSYQSIPILSQKSAVGLIIATGVVGKSLKGRPGVYLSADAGLTWHHVLDGSYSYNFGDHGGVLVATPTLKAALSTNEFRYSTDEGETWNTVQFSPNALRIHGLLTEPGEKTTNFTIFGSATDKHQWVIVNLDMAPVFGRVCKSEDYKLWSLTDPGKGSARCLLGQKEIYQRRIPHTNCYNGLDYESLVFKESCECSRDDYECDFGFKEVINICVRDLSSGVDPYTLPSTCRSGQTYNRTRGYRRVAEDVCIESQLDRFEPESVACPMEDEQEFVLFAQRQSISRISLAADGSPEQLPIKSLKNVIAIEYDFKNSCVYWADIDTDKIQRLCLKGETGVEILVETGLHSVEGIALDWVSNNLYFVDGAMATIEVIRTDIHISGRMRRKILDKPHLDKPRGVVVYPTKGYLFWSDWSAQKPSISRAMLDGSDVKQLITSPTVHWPNGIAIDYQMDKLYWVDAKEDYIGSSDLDGKNMRYVIRSRDFVPHPFSVGVYKDWIYWDDWERQAIFMAYKHDGSGIKPVAMGLQGLMDLKIFKHGAHQESSVCATSLDHKSPCSHLCMAKEHNQYVCLCPDGFKNKKLDNGSEICLCDDGTPASANGTCKAASSTCSAGHFYCNNGLCIPNLWRCDGDNDCADSSDEANCAEAVCQTGQFACDSGRCIPLKWKCDFDNDCGDGKDERNCTYPSCASDQFMCKNRRCINKHWRCDFEDDCRDGSDEVNCTQVQTQSPCTSSTFRCESNGQCLPQTWQCDGDPDCPDQSDEKNCSNHTCKAWQHRCNDGHCIFNTWVCDGDRDCLDGSDEKNCTATTVPISTTSPSTEKPVSCATWMFTCNTGSCIPYWWKCDQVSDCSDGSDEFDCAGQPSTINPTGSTTTTPNVCGANHYQCDNGMCIWESWVCDGEADCPSGEDERTCHSTCSPNNFRCLHSAGCIPHSQICNGVKDCADGSDEANCKMTDIPTINPSPSRCPDSTFACDLMICLPLSKRCDKIIDCMDNTDEQNCSVPEFKIRGIFADSKMIKTDSILIYWLPPLSEEYHYEYIAAISEAYKNNWINGTLGEASSYEFKNLKPSTLYNITVYVKRDGASTVYAPGVYTQYRTQAGVPPPPRNLHAVQLHNNVITIQWDYPEYSFDAVTGYRIYVEPSSTFDHDTVSDPNITKYTIQDVNFRPGVTYKIWMTSLTFLRGIEVESSPSNITTITPDAKLMIEPVKNLKLSDKSSTSVILSWEKSPSQVDGYKINITGPYEHATYKQLSTALISINVSVLSPGMEHVLAVAGFLGNQIGPWEEIAVTTTGEKLLEPRDLKAELVKGTTVKISWSPVKYSRKEPWVYGVYSGMNADEMIHSQYQVTNETSMLLPVTHACESYTFSVALVAPLGYGPLSKLVSIDTEFDSKAPPKSLQVSRSPSDELTMVVTWRSSCQEMNDKISYIVTVKEQHLDGPFVVELPSTKKAQLATNFTIRYGGKYTITVRTAVVDSIPTHPVRYFAPILPVPKEFHVEIVADSSDSLLLNWEPPTDLPKHLRGAKLNYVVCVSLNESNQVNATEYKVKNPPFTLTDLPAGKIYYISVLLEDEEGYRSDPTPPSAIIRPLESKGMVLPTSHLVAVVVPVMLLLVVLVGGLMFFAIRHRRLQNSFLSFANSHYDTRSGATTFNTADELDEEDSPMIRGFSDDEPLVIA